METENVRLYLICGKIAAGKSTLSERLSNRSGAVLLSEDHWLSTLYPGQITSIQDYVRCSGHLRDVIGPHVVELLRAGLSVVMDFPANTLEQRGWLKGLFEAADVAHELHFLDLPDAICKERLRLRNQAGDHAYQASEADFDLFTRYFVPPADEEAFNLIVHRN